MMNDYHVVRLTEMAAVAGEEELQEILSGFLSPENPEIENFIHHRALEFARKKMSMTHMVMDQEGRFAGFYTLTHKPVSVRRDTVSKTFCRRLERHARYDASTDEYHLSAFLIAQFGKNYSLNTAHRISGKALMNLALSTLKEVQQDIGGEVVFLECEDKEKLLDFYQSKENRFLRYGERISSSEEDSAVRYIQLLRFV